MRTAPDTFTRFLYLVTADVAVGRRGSIQQASELYISRSQLDRIVTAAADEPPARLRRRILLERAAYRLVADPDATVLDIGIEAGYSSHEAFSRAFARAFDVTPSAWRRNPGAPLLAAPNNVHFFPAGGLRLPSPNKVESVDLVVTMTEHHIWLLQQLIERAGRLSPAELDAPIEISFEGIDSDPTIRSVLSRLVGQLDMWNQAMLNQPYDFSKEDHERLDSMRARLGECGPRFLRQVRDACTSGSLDDEFVDATGGTPLFFTYGGMIAHVLSYGAYRRTMVYGGLVAAGITDLEDDPLAWEPVRPTGPTAP